MIPKFRALLKRTKQMVDVEAIDFYNESITWLFNDYVEIEQFTEEECFSDIILMQSTGLTDKNGKEIFEGDILEVSYNDIHGEFCGCDVVAKNPFDYSLTEANWLNHAYEIEIIGNIHEHSDLLNT